MASTDRIYAAALKAFEAWCMENSVKEPIRNADVARYLEDCWRQRGANSVPVHMAAINRMMKSRGQRLATKSQDIQRVIVRVRQELKKAASR